MNTVSNIHASFSVHFDSKISEWKIYSSKLRETADYPNLRSYRGGIKAGWISLDGYLKFIKQPLNTVCT